MKRRNLLRPFKVIFAGPEGTYQGVLFGRGEVHVERLANRYAEMKGWTVVSISFKSTNTCRNVKV